MADTLTLFTSLSAFPNPQCLRIFMHEKGIADRFAETVYDMSPIGEQRGWPHLKMNPWGETPTLRLADGLVSQRDVCDRALLDDSFEGSKIMSATAHERGLGEMWDNRAWVWFHILYPIVTAFLVLHEGLGPKLELTYNPAWGEHSQKVALAHAALVDRHLSDARQSLLSGDRPIFSDITLATAIALSKYPVNATPLDERLEHLDALWRRWQTRSTFLAAYADRLSGVPELDARA